jgi:hypothetical protein
MQLTITIECDNAAFDDDFDGEIARILATLVSRLTWGGLQREGERIKDSNGNTVGRYEFEG